MRQDDFGVLLLEKKDWIYENVRNYCRQFG